ncbi:hypothetical protein CU098_009243, partial [Rhizopus stolonifer]
MSANNMNRSKSLTRPERQRPRTGIINSNPKLHRQYPQPLPDHLRTKLAQQKQNYHRQEPPSYVPAAFRIVLFASALTNQTKGCNKLGVKKQVALCYLVAFLCGALAYITYGLNINLCPSNQLTFPYSTKDNRGRRAAIFRQDKVYVFGQVYNFDTMQNYFALHSLNLTTDFRGMELSSIFDGDTDNSCAYFYHNGLDPTLPSCNLTSNSGNTLKQLNGACLLLADLHAYSNNGNYLSFEWMDIRPHNLGLIGNTVVNLTHYLDDSILLPGIGKTIQSNRGNDMTYALSYTKAGKHVQACLLARYSAGIASEEVASCIADNIIMVVLFIVILIIIAIRYSMACLFQWFISHRLVKPGGRSNWLAWRSIKGGNDDPANHIPGPYNDYRFMTDSARMPNSSSQINTISNRTDIVHTKLYTVMLVTCYSEGEEGLRTTMDSLASTTYSDKHKIFFVIADGLITGAGETRSTPDIV